MDDKATDYGFKIIISDFDSLDDVKFWATISCDDADYLIYIKAPIEFDGGAYFYDDSFYDSFLKDNETDIITGLTESLLKARKIKNDGMSKEKILKRFFEFLEPKVLDIYNLMSFNL